jgi:hypothetical protein
VEFRYSASAGQPIFPCNDLLLTHDDDDDDLVPCAHFPFHSYSILVKNCSIILKLDDVEFQYSASTGQPVFPCYVLLS